MVRFLLGAFFIVHGLITVANSMSGFGRGPGVQNPAWLAWWPTALGRSWLFARLEVEQTAASGVGGLLWLVGGVALLLAGLGVFGVLVPAEWWRALAVGGAAISLLALALYFHPYYALGVGINVAILAALLWANWPAAGVIGA
jgi:hypothetical protein